VSKWNQHTFIKIISSQLYNRFKNPRGQSETKAQVPRIRFAKSHNILRDKQMGDHQKFQMNNQNTSTCAAWLPID